MPPVWLYVPTAPPSRPTEIVLTTFNEPPLTVSVPLLPPVPTATSPPTLGTLWLMLAVPPPIKAVVFPVGTAPPLQLPAVFQLLPLAAAKAVVAAGVRTILKSSEWMALAAAEDVGLSCMTTLRTPLDANLEASAWASEK